MKKLFFLTALLCASLMGWATQYCETVLTGSNTANSAGEWTSSNGQNLTFTASRVGNTNKTLFKLTSTTSTITGLYVATLEISGGGSTSNFNVAANTGLGGWTVEDGVLQKEVEWDTYPTSAIQVYLVARRSQAQGGSDIMGAVILDIDVSEECPDTSDKTKPVMTSASVASYTHNSVVLNVAATDNIAVTKYIIKNHSDNSSVGEYAAASTISITELSASTAYNWDVYAKDAAGNESESGINVTFTTDAAPSNIYTNLEIGHQGAQNPDINSYILLSIGSDGHGHTIVNIKQDNAKNNAMFDYINIVDKKEIGADVTTGGSAEMAIVFPTPTPDEEGKIAFDIQWSTVNWTGRWQCHAELPANATSATANPYPDTYTYCKYTDSQLRSNNANVAVTWSTDASGNVVIDISDGEGASNTAFRNGGFENEGSFAASWLVYSGTNHATCESATEYFNNGGILSNNNKRFTLTKKADLPANAVIAFYGHAFSWTNTQAASAYTENKWFAYSYGEVCPFLDAPTNVSIDANNIITFDAVSGADSYTAYISLSGIQKYMQVVASGDELTFIPLEDGAYDVTVVASGAGKVDSDPSTAFVWNLTAASIVLGNSEYCEHNMSSGNTEAAFTWETDDSGNIVITISEVLNGENDPAHFRANSLAIGNFSVGAGHVAGSTYFSHPAAIAGDDHSQKTLTLSLIDPSNAPALGEKIYYHGVVEYRTSENTDAWPTLDFEWTYGTICSGIAVSATPNNNTMGTAVVKKDSEIVTNVEENDEVSFIATPNEGYEFLNWTKGGLEVSTNATYVTTITQTTNLVANFDYIRETYCHTEVLTDVDPQYKVYLTVGKGATEGTYQVKIYGSEELTITGINNANTAVNHIKYLTYDGIDVPLTIDNEGWSFEATGYGVITSAEFQPQTGHTWRDINIWRPDLYMGTNHGEQVINNTLKHYFNWDNNCAEDPGIGTAISNTEAEVKAVKMIENGQLIIIKNGVKYNVAGQQVK